MGDHIPSDTFSTHFIVNGSFQFRIHKLQLKKIELSSPLRVVLNAMITELETLQSLRKDLVKALKAITEKDR
jgi:hypothetical protein